MSDTLTSELRKRNMSAIRSSDTEPEFKVRRLLHRMGYRYRLHCLQLPRCPDIVFGRLAKVVFVNGCFWHSHSCKDLQRLPKSNSNFLHRKLSINAARDRRNINQLNSMGWKELIVWKCELSSEEKLAAELSQFLGLQGGSP